jgi:hypothetical protein
MRALQHKLRRERAGRGAHAARPARRRRALVLWLAVGMLLSAAPAHDLDPADERARRGAACPAAAVAG